MRRQKFRSLPPDRPTTPSFVGLTLPSKLRRHTTLRRNQSCACTATPQRQVNSTRAIRRRGGTQSGGDGSADGAGASQDRGEAPLHDGAERQKPAPTDGAPSVTQDLEPGAVRCSSWPGAKGRGGGGSNDEAPKRASPSSCPRPAVTMAVAVTERGGEGEGPPAGSDGVSSWQTKEEALS